MTMACDSPLMPPDEATAEAVAKAFKLDGFFPEFNAELCGKVFPRSGVRHYRQDEVLIRESEIGRDLFLILAGEVAVLRQTEKTTASPRPFGHGTVFGEIALLADGVRTATVAAVTPAFAFRLAHEDLDYLLKNNAELAEHLRTLARQRSGE